MALSFAADIKPMFAAMDQDHMLNQVGLFDLGNDQDGYIPVQEWRKLDLSHSIPRSTKCPSESRKSALMI
jgi:hypothetical protein